MRNLQSAMKVLSQNVHQQRLAGPRRTNDQTRPLGPLDTPRQCLPSVLLRPSRYIGVRSRSGCERSVRQQKMALVHNWLGQAVESANWSLSLGRGELLRGSGRFNYPRVV